MTQPTRQRPLSMVFMPVAQDNSIHADIEVPAGTLLSGIDIATHNAGDALVPGRLYFTKTGWARCVAGAGCAFVPSTDRLPLRGDGSHDIIGWVAATHFRLA